MPKKNVKTRAIRAQNLTHGNIPASVQLVKEVRDELKAEIGSLRAEIGSVDAKVDAVRHELGAQIQQVLVSVHRTQTLMEEQRSENRVVLDGLKNVTERQDRMEGDIVEIRDTLRTLRSVSH